MTFLIKMNSLTRHLRLLFIAASTLQVQGVALNKNAVLGTATVNLAVPQGTPSHLASGFIYGIPDTPDQIPDHFYTDMGFRYTRAGGSQLPAPARGWVYGANELQVRAKLRGSRMFFFVFFLLN